jgi:hypothetical protein
MWFLIAAMAVVLVALLVTRSVSGRRGGVHAGGVQPAHDVSLQGIWTACHGTGRPAGTWDGWGDGGWGGGDGAGTR